MHGLQWYWFILLKFILSYPLVKIKYVEFQVHLQGYSKVLGYIVVYRRQLFELWLNDRTTSNAEKVTFNVNMHYHVLNKSLV